MGFRVAGGPAQEVDRGDRRVAVVQDVGDSVHQVFARLAEAGFDLADARSAATGALSDRTRALAGAWAVIAGGEPYGESLLGGLGSLRVIARFGSGFDAIDVAAATRAGIAVTIARDANSESVADYTIGLILAVVRRIVVSDRLVRSGAWRQHAPTGDLTGSRVLIVGLGNVGKAVARRLAAFGCVLMAVDPVPDRDFCKRYNVTLVTLADGLARADVVTVHAPLTAETKYLVGAPELALMSRTSVLVNTARGDVVDQTALVDALRCGRIAGAGLDVFASEPLAIDDPLTSLGNVVLSGHVASMSGMAYANLVDAVEETLLWAAAGEIPTTCVNPEVDSGRRTALSNAATRS
jgi:phosphoglycerate dehydrogenase-like enzyme